MAIFDDFFPVMAAKSLKEARAGSGKYGFRRAPE